MSITSFVTMGNIITLSTITGSGDTHAYFYLPLEGKYQNLLEYEGYYDG